MQPENHHHQPHRHPATPIPAATAAALLNRGKKRGSYSCGRCGQPKKGHKCTIVAAAAGNFHPSSTPAPNPSAGVDLEEEEEECGGSDGLIPPARRRRALSFADDGLEEEEERFDLEEELDADLDLDLEGSAGLLPMSCLRDIFGRLPPIGLMAAAGVCRRWREISRRVWRAAEEVRVRVPAKVQIVFVGSILQKCSGLLRLSLSLESDFDATTLACIAFSCPSLQVLEIFMSGSSVNRISGDELSRFVSDKRSLTTLKMEGCSNLGGFVFTSTSLFTIWLSDLHSLSKMVFNCPNLNEISLHFSCRENDRTNLTSVMDDLGRSCPKLQNIHIASTLLSHTAVLALTAAKLGALRMLSLIHGLDINDASIASIASSFPNLEFIDLSGSSITDSGIGMICNVYPDTLSKLLLALCPNITSSGIQFAAAQLPLLELLDCGMTLCNPDLEKSTQGSELSHSRSHLMYQKLIIKHDHLKKLSLWGCSDLDALYLNCPNICDLNLNSCTNLHPERLSLECPNLETVHASHCPGMLIQSIKTQVSSDLLTIEDKFLTRRLSDGSKRVGVPKFCSSQILVDKKCSRPAKRRRCQVME